MIKVLRIINRFNLGGPTYNATFLTKFLSDDFETMLIGGGHEKHEGDSLFITEKYDVHPILIDSLKREINFKEDRKAYKEIRKIIREFKPDIVHTHASKSGAIGRLAAYKENVPVIIHTYHGHVFHSYFGKVKTKIYQKVEQYLAKKTDKLIAISPLQKTELSEIHKIAKPGKFKVIQLGFDLAKFQEDWEERRVAFRKKWELADDDIAIGIIGRVTAIKNHAGFIASIDYLGGHTNKKVDIFIVGDGDLRPSIEILAKEVEKKYNHINIHFTSWIKKIELILPGLELVCLTSLNEGTPVSLIEAQAANRPVISTNVGGVKDIVLEGQTGIVVDSFSTDEYGKVLLDLVENKEKLANLSKSGWDFVKDKFHYSRLCKDFENLYKELLDEKK